jgi:hypothetical protein
VIAVIGKDFIKARYPGCRNNQQTAITKQLTKLTDAGCCPFWKFWLVANHKGVRRHVSFTVTAFLIEFLNQLIQPIFWCVGACLGN